MKYVDEYRNKRLIDKVAREIRSVADKGRFYNIMEVCGTHTMNIFRFGLRDLLPSNIRLMSGPGCPVCVTPNEFIDKAIWLGGLKGVIIATFGDMFRVPGSYSSLEKEKAAGCDVRMVYSSMDALDIARKNPEREVVFLGVGFETTSPTVAQSILAARKDEIGNFSVLSGHKTMPEALRSLVRGSRLNIGGFLLPGHVSVIIGKRPYEFLSKSYKKRCVIAGFEPLDILEAILMLITQKRPAIEIQYTRVTGKSGNPIARRAMEKVFDKKASLWRGIGKIKDSGLVIKDNFSDFDAEKRFSPKIKRPKENKGCICGDVLQGVKTPLDCGLFGKACNPENPVGSCMVSTEGTCAAYYKYRGKGNG
ncbi:MAG: hydrogenase formation protein HypD [Candidatus Omnitrophica bacterium]|nr:hydrogenase formation protein HypD [Candidatus Omnitrophota bacterium]